MFFLKRSFNRPSQKSWTASNTKSVHLSSMYRLSGWPALQQIPITVTNHFKPQFIFKHRDSIAVCIGIHNVGKQEEVSSKFKYSRREQSQSWCSHEWDVKGHFETQSHSHSDGKRLGLVPCMCVCNLTACVCDLQRKTGNCIVRGSYTCTWQLSDHSRLLDCAVYFIRLGSVMRCA